MSDEVWILDMVGYDAGTGKVFVFSTPELAKAWLGPEVEWEPGGEAGERGWTETGKSSVADVWVIYPCVVDPPVEQ